MYKRGVGGVRIVVVVVVVVGEEEEEEKEKREKEKEDKRESDIPVAVWSQDPQQPLATVSTSR